MLHHGRLKAPPPLGLGLALASLLAATLLVACGGQASTASTTGQTPGTPPIPVDTSQTMAGAYTGTLNSSDFVGFLTPGLEWYALYFLNTSSTPSIYPDIYHVSLSGQPTSKVNITSPGLTAFQFTTRSTPGGPSHLTTGGSVAISATGGASNYAIALSGITLANNTTNPAFTVAPASTFAVDGNWTGTWADALGDIRTSAPLSFSQGSASAGFGSCQTMQLQLTLASDAASSQPYYKATLSIPAQTGCARAPNGTAGLLEGIGFVHGAASGNAAKRLEIIVIDKLGSGVSFSGAQQ